MASPGAASPVGSPGSFMIMPIMVVAMLICVALLLAAYRGRVGVLWYLGSWLALAVLFAALTGSMNVPMYRTLAARGVRTEGTVVALTPEYHGTVQYRYEVRGRSYERQRGSEPPNPPTEALRLGQKVVVVYDPASPSTAVLGDPGPMLADELISVALTATIMPTAALLMIYLVQRSARRRGGLVIPWLEHERWRRR